jgi:hypothetical protein
MRRSLLGTVAVLAAFASITAPGLAKTGKASAPLLKGNETCGSNNAGKVIGRATVWAFNENTPAEYLGVSVKLTHASPGTLYEVELWQSSPCSLYLAWEDPFETSAKGVASWGIGTVTTTPGEHELFAAVLNLKTGERTDATSVFLK